MEMDLLTIDLVYFDITSCFFFWQLVPKSSLIFLSLFYVRYVFTNLVKPSNGQGTKCLCQC
jgi:hypothetical protein